VLASILDRLLDLQKGEPGALASGGVDAAEALRRDIEDLLNTRNHFGISLHEAWPESSRSVLGYGLADAEECLLTDAQEIDDLRSKVEATLAVHEPRLQDVHVRVLEAPRPFTQDVVLEIRALVRVSAEEVVWNSTLRGPVVVVQRSS
jgi:type VI secretion system lysozyme-like protein